MPLPPALVILPGLASHRCEHAREHTPTASGRVVRNRPAGASLLPAEVRLAVRRRVCLLVGRIRAARRFAATAAAVGLAALALLAAFIRVVVIRRRGRRFGAFGGSTKLTQVEYPFGRFSVSRSAYPLMLR